MKSFRSGSRQQQGFTLIELVVVLIILGILAAFAIPRFINVSTEARRAATDGLAGAIRSASTLTHALALARNVTTGTVPLEGTNVDVVNSYPAGTAAGIGTAVLNIAGFTAAYAAGVATFVPLNAAAPASCVVTYTEAPAGGAAAITVVTTDCS